MGSCISAPENSTVHLIFPTERKIIRGPIYMKSISPLANAEIFPDIIIEQNQYIIVENITDSTLNRIVKGPHVYQQINPYEKVSNIQSAIVLDQDDYIIVTKRDGTKRTFSGPYVFIPEIGDKCSTVTNSTIIPQNKYIVVRDTSRDEDCDQVIPGPRKYIPQPYDIILPDPTTRNNIRDAYILGPDDYIVVTDFDGKKSVISGPTIYIPKIHEICTPIQKSVSVPNNNYIIVRDLQKVENSDRIVVGPVKFTPSAYEIVLTINNKVIQEPIIISKDKAILVLGSDGRTRMLTEEAYYILGINEKLIGTVDITRLDSSQFMILSYPDSKIDIKCGPASFFVEPTTKIHKFEINQGVFTTTLSTLPNTMKSVCIIYIANNIQIELRYQITYEIFDIDKFSQKPIEFFTMITSTCRNSLLDLFAGIPQNVFRDKYTSMIQTIIKPLDDEYQKYGIKIYDVQVIELSHTDKKIQETLSRDIYSVIDADVKRREAESQAEVERIKMQIEIANAESRIKREENLSKIEIAKMGLELEKEKELSKILDQRRQNQSKEGESEGRSVGMYYRELLESLPSFLTNEQKIDILYKHIQFEDHNNLYGNVRNVVLNPDEVGLGGVVRSDPEFDRWREEHKRISKILTYNAAAETEKK